MLDVFVTVLDSRKARLCERFFLISIQTTPRTPQSNQAATRSGHTRIDRRAGSGLLEEAYHICIVEAPASLVKASLQTLESAAAFQPAIASIGDAHPTQQVL